MNKIQHRQIPLDSRQLNAFASLARTGSIPDAARELSLTPSAICHSLRTLEQELGCRLLNRVGKKMELTAAGEACLFHAHHGLRSFAQARQTIQDFNQWGRQRLKIGADATLFQRMLPTVLARLQGQQPHLLFTAKTVRPSEFEAVLQSGEVEVILGTPPCKAPDIEFTPILDASFKIVVSSTHRWAAQGCAPVKELAKEPCLLTDKSHPARQAIDRYFAAEGIVVNGIAEIESLEVIKNILVHGAGMSILPEWIVKDELKAGLLAGFSPGKRQLRQSWGLLRLRSRPVNSIECNFQRLCAEAAKSLHSPALA